MVKCSLPGKRIIEILVLTSFAGMVFRKFEFVSAVLFASILIECAMMADIWRKTNNLALTVYYIFL